MVEHETPSSVMFAVAKEFGKVSNKQLARLVLNTDRRFGDDKTLLSRIEEKTFLSREIVHSRPGAIPRSWLSDLGSAAQSLRSKMAAKLGAGADEKIVDELCGPSAERMAQALASYGEDDRLYGNMVSWLMAAELEDLSARASALVMLFVASGCLGDVHEAVRLTQRFVSHKLGHQLLTEVALEGDAAATEGKKGAGFRLALCRQVDGHLRMPSYPVSMDPEGTEIGLLPTSHDAITDVDSRVSRSHLRVFTDGNAWFVQGLGSTNGTTLVRAETGEEVVVEPPARAREAGAEPEPVPVYPGDFLVLAGTTRFLVMGISTE